MKQTKKANWKKILLCSTLLANMAVTQLAPVTQVFADELKTSDSTTTTSSEATEATESKEPISTNESTTSDSAVATPTLTQTKEVTTLSTGEELANRANPTDVQGLSDDQIQALANALYGGMAKLDPSFGMSVVNDKGEAVVINFNRGLSINSRSTGTGSANINYRYSVSKGAWSAWGEFFQKLYIDGKLAYCVQPGVVFIPGEGFTAQTSLDGISPQQKAQINDLLNFGAKDSDSNEFYVATSLSIWEAVGWTTVSTSLGNYGDLKAQINKNIVEFAKLPSFNNQEVTVKVGESITLDDTNGVLGNYKVQTDGTNSSIKISGNKITITPSVNSNDGSIDLYRNSYYSGNQYFYVNGNGSQAVSTGRATDPSYGHLKVKVIKEGDLQIGKQDGVTGNMVPNTTYEGTVGDDQVKFTTDADGWAPISNKYIHDTEFDLGETHVPEGYVLDSTRIKGKIVGGETTKIIQKNDLQKAGNTLEKEEEVYNAEESTKQGKPIYGWQPAAELSFTQKSITDVTAPDGKTVIEKAGEYTDTQVTNADGSATFKPFYNGAQNKYELTENTQRDNYRPMEPIKFSVPWGESSVSVVGHRQKVKNYLKKGKLILNKKNSIDLANPLNLAGATFHIKGEANTNTADVDLTTTTTEKSTEMEVKDGWYFISEIEYPTGFTQPEGKTETMRVLVKDGETTVVDWENTPINKLVTPTTPKTTTVAPVSTKTTGTLPHTGEKSNSWIVALGAMTIVSVAVACVFYKKPKNAA